MNTQTLPNHDFTNAKVGDPIYTVQYGEGSIVKIAKHTYCPILAQFGGESILSFTLDGKYSTVHTYPTAFTEPVKLVAASYEPFVEQEMMVWDDENGIQDACKQIVFAKFRGKFVAVGNSHCAFYWQNALPIDEWEAKVRENKNAERIKELEAEIAAKQSELNKLKGGEQ